LGGVRVNNINTNIQFDQLYPLQTKPAQHIYISHISEPLELDNGDIEFQFLDNTQLHIKNMSWKMGDGTLSAHTMHVPFHQLNQTKFTLAVKNIALGDILKVGSEALQTTGTLNGQIPVILKDGNLLIHHGMLETSKPGTIAYTRTR